jgi:hypothetical protein
MPKLNSCQKCGAKLKLAPTGRRKRFCSDACRQAAFRNEMTGLAFGIGEEISAHEATENKGRFLSRNEELALPRSSARSSKQLKFEKQNGVTYKLTDGQQVNTGCGRASRALGYIVEVFPGRWMARVRNLCSDLLPFGAVKQEAVRLYGCRGENGLDWIRELSVRCAGEIDRSAPANEKRKTSFDLMGGGKPWLNPVHVDMEVIRKVIEVETCKPLRDDDTLEETSKGDDYLINCDPDGYPELPACLDRRKPRLKQAA